MNFLFWNVGKRSLSSALVALVQSTKTNVLVLAEYEDDDHAFLRALREREINYFALENIGCTRIKVFTDVEPSCFRHKREADRYSIREFSKPGYQPFLLALVHLQSKLHMSEQDQLQEAFYFRQEVEVAESESKNMNTIILGDFNMNPFEPGMISATAMNSLPCLRTAKSGSRFINGREHSFFYNPTWNLFGDLDGVPGTYYYKSPSYNSFYWNMLDQVVLRPSIADRLDKKSLRIITKAGSLDLLDKNGRPAVSDHLPIFFTLDLSIGGKYEEPMAR